MDLCLVSYLLLWQNKTYFSNFRIDTVMQHFLIAHFDPNVIQVGFQIRKLWQVCVIYQYMKYYIWGIRR